MTHRKHLVALNTHTDIVTVLIMYTQTETEPALDSVHMLTIQYWKSLIVQMLSQSSVQCQ